MPFTYVLSTDIGKVRLLVPDRVEAEALFQDDEVEVFLSLEGSNIKRAAAAAKEAIAGDQVLVLKVIKLLDLQTDGAAVARELRQQANALREQAANEEANEEGGAFDIAEMTQDVFSARERLWKQALRGY
jgi:SepF-like predicted cell division protein (DUF552 family)